MLALLYPGNGIRAAVLVGIRQSSFVDSRKAISDSSAASTATVDVGQHLDCVFVCQWAICDSIGSFCVANCRADVREALTTALPPSAATCYGREIHSPTAPASARSTCLASAPLIKASP